MGCFPDSLSIMRPHILFSVHNEDESCVNMRSALNVAMCLPSYVRLRAAVRLPSCAQERAAVRLTYCTCASYCALATVRVRAAVYLPSCVPVCMRAAEHLPPYVRARAAARACRCSLAFLCARVCCNLLMCVDLLLCAGLLVRVYMPLCWYCVRECATLRLLQMPFGSMSSWTLYQREDMHHPSLLGVVAQQCGQIEVLATPMC
jgi:hypothetical protein